MSTALTEAVGWTILHFVWQGALVAILVALALVALRGARPTTRYAVACAGLTAMLLAPLATLASLLERPAPALAAELLGLMAVAPDADTTTLADRVETVLPLLTGFWALGVVLLFVRTAVLWTRARRWATRAIEPAPNEWVRAVETWRHRIGVRRRVRIATSALATVPGVVGFLSPIVLMPATAFTNLTANQLHAVIVHELAHVRRYDDLVNAMQLLVEALLFFHPAVWWLSSRIRTEREYCCDDVVVGACGDPVAYAAALCTLDELRDPGMIPALASTGGPLMKRIERLVRPAAPAPRSSSILPIGLIIAALVTGAALSAARASGPPDESPRASSTDERTHRDALLAHLDALKAHLSELRAHINRGLASGALTMAQAHRQVDGFSAQLHELHAAHDPGDEFASRLQTARDFMGRGEVHAAHEHLLETLAATEAGDQHQNMRALQALAERLHALDPEMRRQWHDRLLSDYDRLTVEHGSHPEAFERELAISLELLAAARDDELRNRHDRVAAERDHLLNDRRMRGDAALDLLDRNPLHEHGDAIDAAPERVDLLGGDVELQVLHEHLRRLDPAGNHQDALPPTAVIEHLEHALRLDPANEHVMAALLEAARREATDRALTIETQHRAADREARQRARELDLLRRQRDAVDSLPEERPGLPDFGRMLDRLSEAEKAALLRHLLRDRRTLRSVIEVEDPALPGELRRLEILLRPIADPNEPTQGDAGSPR